VLVTPRRRAPAAQVVASAAREGTRMAMLYRARVPIASHNRLAGPHCHAQAPLLPWPQGMEDEARGARIVRNEVAAELSRRQFIQRAGILGAGAMIVAALPIAERIVVDPAIAANPNLAEATLQAAFDTIIPGRPATKTDLGHQIHPKAIAGVDPEPGAVEADALLLSHHRLVGFDALAPAFLSELEARSAAVGGDFLDLDYAKRERVCLGGLDYGNTTRQLWEAAAAVPYTAFCGAATQRNATDETASGYAVMGFPGTAPHGYRDFSYRRRLNRGVTRRGYLR
jgi:hypothetical protein